MTHFDIAHLRLRNQHLSTPCAAKPEEVVGWLGAVQAQDVAGATWAVAQRAAGLTCATVERACDDGSILRTHVMRPTWHFVTPADIRWMLELTAPRVNALCAYYYRRFELDDAEFARCNALLVKALEGGKHLTRAELRPILHQAGIVVDDALRLTHIMMRAELDGVVCSGAKRGKQQTYALLDERAPHAIKLTRDEARAELARRYFASHGPATLADFVWWSGLTVADAKAGLEAVQSQLIRETIGDTTYWLSPSMFVAQGSSSHVHLLPNFDEYLVSYSDRSTVTKRLSGSDKENEAVIFSNTVVIDGQVVGTWKRTLVKDTVVVAFQPATSLTATEEQALVGATERYGTFLGKRVTCS